MSNSFAISPHSSEFEPSPRWVRVYFNRQLIADSKQPSPLVLKRDF